MRSKSKFMGALFIAVLLIGAALIPASAHHQFELHDDWEENGTGTFSYTDGAVTLSGENMSIETTSLGTIADDTLITLNYDGFCTAGAPRIFVQVDGGAVSNSWDGTDEGDCAQNADNPASGTIEFTVENGGEITLAGIVNDTLSPQTVTVSNLMVGDTSVPLTQMVAPDPGDSYDETKGAEQAGQCEGEEGARKWDTDDGHYDGHIIFDGEVIDVLVEGDTITFSESVEFCVKASNANSGRQSGTSYKVDFENQGDNFPDISNFVLYLADDNGNGDNGEEPEKPTEEPTEEPVEEEPTEEAPEEEPEEEDEEEPIREVRRAEPVEAEPDFTG